MWKLMISFWRDNDNDGFSGGDGQSVKAVKNTKSYFFSFYLGACRFDENYWYIAQLATAMFCLANEPHSPAFFINEHFMPGLFGELLIIQRHHASFWEGKQYWTRQQSTFVNSP